MYLIPKLSIWQTFLWLSVKSLILKYVYSNTKILGKSCYFWSLRNNGIILLGLLEYEYFSVVLLEVKISHSFCTLHCPLQGPHLTDIWHSTKKSDYHLIVKNLRIQVALWNICFCVLLTVIVELKISIENASLSH